LFHRKLRSLQYPLWDRFVQEENKNLIDAKSFRALVVWLEEGKIRHYSINDRQRLRQCESSTWKKEFLKYLEDLKCSRPYSETINNQQTAAVLDWLLSFAIQAEYNDHASLFSQVRPQTTPTPVATGANSKFNCSSPEFLKGIEGLATMLKLPVPDKSVDLVVVLKMIGERIRKIMQVNKLDEKSTTKGRSASVTTPTQTQNKPTQNVNQANTRRSFASAVPTSPPPPSSRDEGVDLSAFPLGFSTGDALVDRAATLLRLLYIGDLRILQNKVNEIIVNVQEYTANPTTDAALGQVGTG